MIGIIGWLKHLAHIAAASHGFCHFPNKYRWIANFIQHANME
jgi:hypothetical protein